MSSDRFTEYIIKAETTEKEQREIREALGIEHTSALVINLFDYYNTLPEHLQHCFEKLDN
jgi:hypothetical protein